MDTWVTDEVIDAEYLQGWLETQEILSDPLTMDKIRRSEEDIAANRGYTPEEIKTMFGL